MARKCSGFVVLYFVLAATLAGTVAATDPDPLQDFCVGDPQSIVTPNGMACKDPKNVTAKDFMFSGLATPGDPSTSPFGSVVTKAFVHDFPALNTLGISGSRIDFAVGGVSAPHWHPRASEMLYVGSGTLLAGFVDTNNNLWTNTLHAGDLTVTPRGLLHFQVNIGQEPAFAIVAFNSQNMGREDAGTTSFGSNIPTFVLEKSFNMSSTLVNSLRGFFT